MPTNVVIGSTNPVKIEASQRAFAKMFPREIFHFSGVVAPSNVSHQPMSSAETLRGALHRLEHIFLHHPQAGYWVAIEGGMQEAEGHFEGIAWVVVRDKELVSKSHTASFLCPPALESRLREGEELGTATDIVFGLTNTKYEQGTVGILTNNLIKRVDYYEHALIFALVPFVKRDLYQIRGLDSQIQTV